MKVYTYDFPPETPHETALATVRSALEDDCLALVVRYGDRPPYSVVTVDEAGRPVNRLHVPADLLRTIA